MLYMIRWLPIFGYEDNYKISSDGKQIVSTARRGTYGGLRLQHVNRGGYLGIHLFKNGKPRWHSVHSLVLATFVGVRPEGMETRHLDGDQKNNDISNLKYGTTAENTQDRTKHGRFNHVYVTQCIKGHPYDEENTGYWKTNRYCKSCKRKRVLARYYRLRNNTSLPYPRE